MPQIRLAQQFEFIAEVDRLKQVHRMTSPIGLERRENSAEHSWHVILMAITLAEHTNHPIDLLKVVKMLAIHDLVEIDAGDTFHYAKSADTDLAAKEEQAAERIFSLLPPEQKQEFMTLWREFESRESAESKFAHCVDRIAAFFLNVGNNGGTWIQHSISYETVVERNQHASEGSTTIWEQSIELINQHFQQAETSKS